MKNIILAIVMTALLVSAKLSYTQEIWVGKDGNIRNIDTRAMIIDGDSLYLATKREIYCAKDVRDRWESIFALPAGENEITCLGGGLRNILVGTKRGLFRSHDHGKSWKNVFKTIIPEKNSILSMEISKYNPKKVLIGTEKGIFMSEDSGERWQEISGSLKNRSVRCIALNKDSIYAGGDEGLYFKKDISSGWERRYVRSRIEKSSDGEMSDSVEIEEDSSRTINCIALKDSMVYIGTDKNILYSDDNGKNWKAFSKDGLVGMINYIALAKKNDRIYSATTKGTFEYVKDKAKWFELYKGIDKNVNISKIILDEETNFLWALTDKGLYKLESGKYMIDQYTDIERNLKTLKIIFNKEPTLIQLQQAAMKFAEVDPDKIKNWRREAKVRALLPKVSFGLDSKRSTNSEIYTSATKDYIIVGPDDINKGFDISVSWELGDLIWSDDQTNIDVRSRLTTQLRNDILDDLRRAYYERKRVQFELAMQPPKDLKTRFEKELRLQELTSAIDDLTGNYLSARIREHN